MKDDSENLLIFNLSNIVKLLGSVDYLLFKLRSSGLADINVRLKDWIENIKKSSESGLNNISTFCLFSTNIAPDGNRLEYVYQNEKPFPWVE